MKNDSFILYKNAAAAAAAKEIKQEEILLTKLKVIYSMLSAVILIINSFDLDFIIL